MGKGQCLRDAQPHHWGLSLQGWAPFPLPQDLPSVVASDPSGEVSSEAYSRCLLPDIGLGHFWDPSVMLFLPGTPTVWSFSARLVPGPVVQQ